jgi:hypothetical protein
MKNRYEGSAATGNEVLDDIQKKLFEIDPNAFRKTMQDLHYQGDEPRWVMDEQLDI